MATRADIEINVKGLKKVQELSKLLDKVSGKVNQLNKTSGTKTEKQTANLEEKRAASMVRVRNIGDQIQRAKEAGLKTEKASRALNRAALANERGKLKLSRAHQQVALKELAIEQKITNENLRQIKAKEREAKIEARNLARRKAQRGTKAALTSGAISGAFPLLFGQGPLGGAAGFAGGFIGTKVGGQMGGFAGGLVATAALQQIQTTITAVGELGQALNPLTADITKLTQAVGLAGTAEAARIRLLEQVEGKQAALAAATQNMALVVGDEGVRTIKEFGENFAAIRANAAEFGLKLQARFAKIFNAIVDKFPSLFGDKGTAEESKALTEAVGEDPVSIALNAELVKIKADLDKLKQDLAARDANIGIPNAPSFLKGGSTLFPSQMPDLNTEVDKAVGDAKLEENIRIAEQELNSINKSLQARKDLLRVQVEDNIAKQKANDITDLILDSTNENIKALKAKKDGTFEEFQIQQRIAEIVQKVKDIGIEENLIDKEKIENLVREEASLKRQVDTAKKLKDAFDSIAKSIQSDIKEGIKGLIKGTSTLGDLLNNVADKFLDIALNQALFGNIGGGSVTGGLFKFLGFARGGRPPVGKPSIVGEKGPELFVPRSSGTIVPNNKLGGGGSTSVTVNVDASGSDVQGDDAGGQELGTLIAAAVQGELVKQQRPGGLLNR